MAEWFKAAVLKTVVGLTPHRGFESLSLRYSLGRCVAQLPLICCKRDGLVISTWEGARVRLNGSAC
jgi:hypothetical protein